MTLSLSVDEVVNLVDTLRWTAVAVQHWTPLPSTLNSLWGVLADSCEQARRSQRVAEAVGESDDDFVIPSLSDVYDEAYAWKKNDSVGPSIEQMLVWLEESWAEAESLREQVEELRQQAYGAHA